jgi:Ala-tRNA(Pro) deacylase
MTENPAPKVDIFEFLRMHDIEYTRQDHPAVFTVAEALRYVPPLPGVRTKNLFLRDRKGRRHFLVVVGYHKSVDLGKLTQLLGVSKLGFCSPDRLQRLLGVEAGSVSIMGLVNDVFREVELIIDQSIWSAEAFQCHPLINTSTIVMEKDDLVRFLELTGHRAQVFEVPGRVDDST